MATTKEHHAKWVHNRSFLTFLTQEEWDDWRCTVAFYAAVHAVESLFDHHDRHHSTGHHARNQRMKQDARYTHIWQSYKHLWNASLVARYMCDTSNVDIPDFFHWISPDDVQDVLIERYLHNVEQAVVIARGLKPDVIKPLKKIA